MKQRNHEQIEQRGGTRDSVPSRSTTAMRALNARSRALPVFGALAFGAIALGAVAIGAVAVGRLVIGRARIRRLEIDELIVRRLKVTENLYRPPSSSTDV
jgi:hypothetical protein